MHAPLLTHHAASVAISRAISLAAWLPLTDQYSAILRDGTGVHLTAPGVTADDIIAASPQLVIDMSLAIIRAELRTGARELLYAAFQSANGCSPADWKLLGPRPSANFETALRLAANHLDCHDTAPERPTR